MRYTEWKGRTGGGSIGQRGLRIMFRYMDVRFGYALLYFIVIFYMLFSRRNCLAIYRYFRHRQGYGCWKSWVATYRNHCLFGQTVLDKFALFSGQAKRYRLTVTGQELFDQALEEDRAYLIASSHVGNFELAGYLLEQHKKQINGIIFGQEAAMVQQYRQQILQEHNVNLIPVAEDMSHLFEMHAALGRNEIISMPCDRVFSGNKKVRLEFFGEEAWFPTGAYYLADRFKAGTLAFFVMKESALHYHVYIRTLETPSTALKREERVEQLARSFVQELERIVRLYPLQWYNYYNFWNSHA